MTLLPSMARRAVLSELMDDEMVDAETFDGCLRDLAKVNRLTGAYRPTLAFLSGLERAGLWPKDRPLDILDVGSGNGDGLRVIDRWADKRGLAVTLTGLDLNPWAARSAAAATGPGRPIRWISGDVFDHDGAPDLVLSALFTHHLDDEQIVRFLRWMDARAGIGWFVNDLERHPAAYGGFTVLAHAMRWHPFVRHDGPVSIRRAFAPSDWRSYLAQAGVQGARVDLRFPFRLCVSKTKAADAP